MTRRWAALLALATVAAATVSCGGGTTSQPLPSGKLYDGATYSLIVPAAATWQASSKGRQDIWVSSLGAFALSVLGDTPSLDSTANDALSVLKDAGNTNTAKQSVTLPSGQAIAVSGGTDKNRTIMYLIAKGGVGFNLMCKGLSDDLCAGIAQSVTLK